MLPSRHQSRRDSLLRRVKVSAFAVAVFSGPSARRGLFLTFIFAMSRVKVNKNQANANKTYNQRTILSDKGISAIAVQLRAQNPRPCLRKLSSVMKKLPWNCPALCGADNLSQWVRDQQSQDGSQNNDALLVSSSCCSSCDIG